MKTDAKRLMAEMTVIVLVAAAIGIAWNHRMLINVFQGKGVQTQAAPVEQSRDQGRPANPPPVPLPLGLMQVKELFDTNEALIIDARDRETYRKGHIRGSVSLPLGEADRLVPDLAAKTPREKLLVVYCNGYDCHDSKTLGERLITAGFGQVFVYEGGYPEWKDAGYPVETGGA